MAMEGGGKQRNGRVPISCGVAGSWEEGGGWARRLLAAEGGDRLEPRW